jgi:hypothetical protein
MILDEFLVKLRETPRDWLLTKDKAIIRRDGCYELCPRLAVDGAVELPQEVKNAIYAAADNKSGHDHFLRRQLLAACGLAPDPK